MNLKNVFFWLLVLVAPVFLWWVDDVGRQWFGNWYSSATTWGQLVGIAGMGLLAGNLLLSGKWRFFDKWFGGLDKAYGLHRSSGKVATYLITAHLVLMSLRFWDGSFVPVTQFVLDLTYQPVLFGKVAYLILVGIVLITIFARMEYEAKRRIHKWMGVAVLFAGLHVFFIPSDVAANIPLRLYLVSLITLALVSYLIKTVIPKRWWLSPNFIVEDVKTVLGGITEITLKPITGGRKFVPGQFAFYQFLAPGLSEVHPFTISGSAVAEGSRWKIDAKESGDFTSRLAALPVGTKVLVEGPFGGFLANMREETKAVWVAGGIGITPFLSYLRTHADSRDWMGKSITLYYSVADGRAPFLLELQGIEDSSQGALRVILWNTNERSRLTTRDILSAGSAYYLCGPGAMISSLRKQLRAKGVSAGNINFEEFKLF